MQKLIKTTCQWATLIVVVALFPACNNQNNAQTDAPIPKAESPASASAALVFDKLVGVWRSEDGKSFEQWTKNADGTFRSAVFSIKGTDTSYNEEANIYKDNEKWIFENRVKGQNDGKAVKFASSILTENTVQFSNPDHDFPTDINYTLPNLNTLHAFIIGPNKNGGRDTIPFNSTRIK